MSNDSQEKTLLISNDFHPVTSGIATFALELWKRLPPERIIILGPELPGAREWDEHNNLPIERRKIPIGTSSFSKLMKMYLNVRWVMKLCRRYNIKKIHCATVLSSGLAAYWVKKKLGIPYTVYVYGSESVWMLNFGNFSIISIFICKKQN